MTLIVELVSAAIGTVAFALLFGVPRNHYLPCGFIGMAGWLMYRVMQLAGSGNTMAVFLAALVIIFLSRLMAVRRQCPATVFMITGIFPLVPGAQIYWATYYLVTSQFDQATSSGMNALKVIVAIVLGIIFVFEIPNQFFLLFRNKSASK